ncbi:MAG: PfaD family polyunsaturated fatty acid/polyketide biosynthesis protein [Gammaproteobacteria bacterium]|nr:PfaD family polyunsaturated fatty acid/polyketide biosynthesis protein [Gammaproteobacteria bacterium]NNJ83750.1 PfaD family polyunsaturated fatty acid/polyketide biosynthesis protein [Gammaproteobacteria bacterium]
MDNPSSGKLYCTSPVEPVFSSTSKGFLPLLEDIRSPLTLILDTNSPRIGIVRDADIHTQSSVVNALPIQGILPPMYPEWLGDRGFSETHGVRFPYVGGEMALGISTPAMVIALGKAGMLGFLGSAGLAPEEIARQCREIQAELDPKGLPWGINLIHSPQEPQQEEALVGLALEFGITRMSVSAFMSLTPTVVYYACKGLARTPDGAIGRKNHLFAKISRPEMAKHFIAPPPDNLLGALVTEGRLTREEAELAAQIPVCEDITVESDSGGHTDFRPMTPLFSAITDLRDRLVNQYGFSRPVRLGVAGGLGTPQSVAAAFAMGAAYVLVGSVHQSAMESGLSESARNLLADAGIADVSDAPAGDMLEVGAKVQVLKRGVLYASRAKLLGDLYHRHESLEEISARDKANLEEKIFLAPLDEVWRQTREYMAQHDPKQLERAKASPHKRMALVFRWYLGQSSRWAVDGETGRRVDYQIWTGPAIGAFNDWVRDSFLAPLENRQVAQIGRNLMEGAAVMTRLQQLRAAGFPIQPGSYRFEPRRLR